MRFRSLLCMLPALTIVRPALEKSETVLILRRTERDMIKKMLDLHMKYLLLLSDFNETTISSTDFSKNTQISWKSFQLEPSCSMHTNRRTDVTKLGVAFRNFANAPKMRRSTSHFSIMFGPSDRSTWRVLGDRVLAGSISTFTKTYLLEAIKGKVHPRTGHGSLEGE